MKLRKKQREFLIGLVAEGLKTDEINERTAQFKPRFKVTRSQVNYYRMTRDIKMDEIQETGEVSALTTGLAIKDARVAVLQKLADSMIEDLVQKKLTWLDQAKTVANEAYSYQEFNRGEIDALRGVLDDIAKELGDRRPDVQVNNTYNFNMEEWKATRAARLKEIAQLPESE